MQKTFFRRSLNTTQMRVETTLPRSSDPGYDRIKNLFKNKYTSPQTTITYELLCCFGRFDHRTFDDALKRKIIRKSFITEGRQIRKPVYNELK